MAEEGAEAVDKSARYQGLERAPLKLFNEKDVEKTVAEWISIVDDTEKFLHGSVP